MKLDEQTIILGDGKTAITTIHANAGGVPASGIGFTPLDRAIAIGSNETGIVGFDDVEIKIMSVSIESLIVMRNRIDEAIENFGAYKSDEQTTA